MSEISLYKPISGVHIFRADVKRDGMTERAIRLYSSQFGSCWQFQVRGPLGNGTFGTRDGKTGIIAAASLSIDDMRDLRDTINALLADCGKT